MKKLLPLFIVGVLILSGLGAVALTDNNQKNLVIKNESIVLTKPIIEDVGKYVKMNLPESTSSILSAGKPMLPVITKVFTLPFGSKIRAWM